MRRCGRPALTVILVLTLVSIAGGEMPYPANPAPCAQGEMGPECIEPFEFSRYLFLPEAEPPLRPNDFNDDWKLTSGTTGMASIDSSPQELFGVRGASVDLAWQVTTGRPDVIIAVIDSGIRWAEMQPDVVNKFYLNPGELPVPEGSDNARNPFDRNRDGVFNIRDYLADDTHAQDSRVSDANGNGVIDPEDLIFLFSDGVDDDGNGYVDDISGWDFFEDDNDPLDEVRYGHGTGESHDSSAEADNGIGGVGTCPNCLLLEIRAGDSFVAEVDAFARGVVYAVDNGARVVQEALGTIDHTRFGQEAIDYAYENGTVVIASAADEESNHHNYPANYQHTVEVNSVTRYSDSVSQTPRSYLYLNGCTNYGGHIAVSVPSSSCSSEATGRGAGMAALVISAALNAVDGGTLEPYPGDDGSAAPFPLSAEEVKQILTTTADDINFDARDDVQPPLPQSYSTSIPLPFLSSQRFPSTAGWDQYFGYGRINANQAVRRVAAGRIPPEAAISSPEWFDIVDAEATAPIAVRGRAAANRAASFTYTLSLAPGVQPAESDFQVVATSESRSEPLVGDLGSIDVAALRQRLPHGAEGPAINADGSPDPDRFTFTVRLQVIDDQGNLGEDRRVLALHHDADLFAGYDNAGTPLHLTSDGTSAPVTADLNGDGIEDLIFGTSDGQVHALSTLRVPSDTGPPTLHLAELPGWPVSTDALELQAEAPAYASGAIQTPVYGAILGGVAVGDLDRDGTLEVVASDAQGKLYVWDRNGVRRSGFPVTTLPQYSFSFRSERNLDTPEGRVPDLVNRHNGDNRLGRALLGGPALGNLDGSADGSLEIVAGSFDRHLYAWHDDGSPVDGWPVLLKDPQKVASVDPVTNEVTLVPGANARLGTKVLVPPSLGDIDGDGRLDVVAVVNEEYGEAPNALFTNGYVNLFRQTGVLDSGNTRVYAIYADGVAHGDSGLHQGWNPGAFLPGWPVKTALLTTELLPVVGSGSNGPPALADVDGDGLPEIGTMSSVGPAYVFNSQGVSFFGRNDDGTDRTLESDVFGADSDAADSPTFGALGAPVLAEFWGRGGGFALLGPTAGLGKLADNNLPAQQTPSENHLAAWAVSHADGSAADGSFLQAFPRRVNDLQFLAAPSIADLDGDGLPEAIEGSGVYDVHAVNAAGAEAPGWPKFTNGWMVGGPTVGDIDGDGRLEVMGTTREGLLFVWRTNGDECGFIPWRRWHHDEWGTGNYATDARPPASLRPEEVLGIEVLSATQVRLDLAGLPGDDLFCGTNVSYDIRFADQPIESAAQFAAADQVAEVPPGNGVRGGGSLTIGDPRLAGRHLYLAMTAIDDASNRSAILPLGPVDFPTAGPTATVTASSSPGPSATPTAPATETETAAATQTPSAAAPTASPTVTSAATATQTVAATATQTAAASPTRPSPTASPTATAFAAEGCNLGSPGGSGEPLLLLPPLLLWLRRRSGVRRSAPRSGAGM